MRNSITAPTAGTAGVSRDGRPDPGRRPHAAGLGWPVFLLGVLVVETSTLPAPAVSPTWGAVEPPPEAVTVVQAGDPEPAPPPPAEVVKEPVNGIDFVIRVPAADYSAPVREGVGKDILDAGPGHYPTSGWPGDDRTVAVAAHNSYWLRVGALAPGDEVILETRWGSFSYQVTSRRIVDPNDATVTVRSGSRDLLLTTCWPLWAGAFATQRLIIAAQQVGAGGPA